MIKLCVRVVCVWERVGRKAREGKARRRPGVHNKKQEPQRCGVLNPMEIPHCSSGWWYTYPSEKWWTSSVGMMTFHSQLFMESHLKFIKIHGFPNISKPPTSLECSRILARPSRLGYIRDHLTTELPNKNSRRLSHPSVPCPCWSRSRTRCFPGRFL